MASVTKDRRTGVYVAKFLDETGKRVNRSTHAKHKPQALALAHEWEAAAKKKRAAVVSGHNPDLTVRDVVVAYVEEHLEAKGRVSAKNVRSAVERYILPALGGLVLDKLEVGHVEAFLDDLERGAHGERVGPQMLNHLRGYIDRSIRRAIKLRRWRGVNVVAEVKTRTIPDPPTTHLPLDEFARMIAAVHEHHRVLCLTAAIVGARKGELLALRKEDVLADDADGAVLTVRRSNWRDVTKTGRPRHIPVPPALVPFLKAQSERFPSSPWMFPDDEGGQRPPHFDAAIIVKRALKKAGIVVGFDHRCRRKGCGFVARHLDGGQRMCPMCGMKLWPTPIPKDVNFHSLRHSAATWMRQAGVSTFATMRVLGHSNEKTLERYSHALVPELRAATSPFVQRVVNAIPMLAAPGGHEVDTDSPPLGAQSPPMNEQAPDFSGAFMVELDGIEPTTSSLQSSRSPN